ncbi:MAG: 4Fe-4S binding protein [Propionibacteriaceae bacterium]|nr:4Fe-4S binding protein [Propionibacteriaceae bacterium]
MGVADLLTGLLPRPTLDEHACSRRMGSGCSVCVDACPQQALQILSSGGRDDHAPMVDPLLCVGCGLCEAQCPVQAISGVGSAAALIVDAARGKEMLRLRCEAARTSGAKLGTDRRGAAGLDVGCLASLHPETVAAAAGALQDGGAIELMRSDCARCPMGAGEAVAAMVAEAGACLAGAGRIHVGVVAEVDEPAEVAQRPSAKMSRRSLFRSASGRKAHEDAVSTAASSRGGRSPRELVLASLSHPGLPRPGVDEGCTGCRACVNICPKDALSFTDADDIFNLTVDPAACVGCGECARVCPEGIVAPHGRLPDAEVVLLTSVQLPRCTTCNMSLSPGESGRCASCSSRVSLVSDVWAEYGL